MDISPSVPTLLQILNECPELEEFALRNLSDAESDSCDYGQTWIPTKLVQSSSTSKSVILLPGITRMRMILNQFVFPSASNARAVLP